MGTKLSVSDLKMHAWRSFITANSRVFARLEAELIDEVGLPLSWYEVMLLISESPARQLRMHEFAETRLLSRSAATRLIDRMEAAGLVQRVACEVDRRGTWVQMTDHGWSVFRRAAPIHVRGIAEHFTSLLDDDEAAGLAELMARVLDRLEPG